MGVIIIIIIIIMIYIYICIVIVLFCNNDNHSNNSNNSNEGNFMEVLSRRILVMDTRQRGVQWEGGAVDGGSII